MMGIDIEEFCLRWNNHHNILVSVLDTLLERETLVDVTLASEGKFIRVHRLVLCACSQYFEELLSHQPEKQAIIFLKDVRFADLKALVDYMYRGEVNVAQDQLAGFLNTAEALKIKGLADKEDHNKVSSNTSKDTNPPAAKSVRSKTSEVPAMVTPSRRGVEVPQIVESALGAHTVLQTAIPEVEANSTLVESHLNAVPDTDDHFIAVGPKVESEMDADTGEDRLEQTENDWSTREAEEDWSSSDAVLNTVPANEPPGAVLSSTFVPGQESWICETVAGPSGTNKSKSNSSLSNNSSRGLKNRGKGGRPTSHLSKMVLVGTGERPFICPRCGNRYKRKDYVTSHLRFECGINPQFTCPICFHRVSQSRFLRLHMAKKHQVLISRENARLYTNNNVMADVVPSF